MKKLVIDGKTPLQTRYTKFVVSANESKQLNHFKGPGIIISASGMATGGRILHHLKHRVSDPKNTIVFVGYQAGGTRGADFLGGAAELKIHGAFVPVRARVMGHVPPDVELLPPHDPAIRYLGDDNAGRFPPGTTHVARLIDSKSNVHVVSLVATSWHERVKICAFKAQIFTR